MPLASSGTISLSQVQTEFGGTNPISMSEYYTNAVSGFTSGITGLPASGTTVSLSVFRGKAKTSSLYNFTTHTFTNAGATGRTGPIISQVRTAYSTTTWAQNNSFLSMTTQGIQEWTVPATGSYTITCAGAGGNKGYGTAGRGYVIVTNQTLNKGQVLKILVGQVGTSAYGRGGGGGTFVATSLNIPLVVCGGGGGVNLYDNQEGKDATGTGGADVAGADGVGVSGCGMHGAGGASFTNNSTYALSFVNGGTGGSMPAGGCVTISYGGFGGGGGGGNGGGGGGGYSGGNGGENNSPYYGGYGGGSYCSTTVNSTSYNPHNTEGYVTISIASIAYLLNNYAPQTTGVAVPYSDLCTTVVTSTGQSAYDNLPVVTYGGYNWLLQHNFGTTGRWNGLQLRNFTTGLTIFSNAQLTSQNYTSLPSTTSQIYTDWAPGWSYGSAYGIGGFNNTTNNGPNNIYSNYNTLFQPYFTSLGYSSLTNPGTSSSMIMYIPSWAKQVCLVAADLFRNDNSGSNTRKNSYWWSANGTTWTNLGVASWRGSVIGDQYGSNISQNPSSNADMMVFNVSTAGYLLILDSGNTITSIAFVLLKP